MGTPFADKDAYNRMMARWNAWQEEIVGQPAVARDISLEQVLSFRMSHRLSGLDSVHWFVEQIRNGGLSSLHNVRWHQADEVSAQLRVFLVSETQSAILNGHHRLVAACLAAHELPQVSWSDSLSFHVHHPSPKLIETWRASTAEMDPAKCARYDQIVGALKTLGTLGDYVGDFTPFQSRTGSV